MAQVLREQKVRGTGRSVTMNLAESPLTCVAVGSGRSLEEFDVIHRMNSHHPSQRRRRRRY